MKASPEQQLLLLDLQALDTRLTQLAHREGTLPETGHLRDAQVTLDELEGQLVRARTAADDVSRELAKAEADVQQVRDRAARNQQRLDAGIGTAKDLAALQHELEMLARRQSDLEEIELEVMERSEGLQAKADEVSAARDAALADRDAMAQARAKALDALVAEREQVEAKREPLAGSIEPGLIALYEKVRTQAAGTAVAVVRGRRCGGCQLDLNPTDVARIRAADPDEIVRCEECRGIMVRTSESGL